MSPRSSCCCAFWLLRNVFEGRDVPNSLPRAGAVFLLGFVSQFFIENDTLYALWAGVVLAVWYRLSRKSWSAPVLAFLLGTALGALLLFLSPSYGLIWGRGGAYGTDLGQGSGGVWATVLEQQGEVCRYLASGCPVLVISPHRPALGVAGPVPPPGGGGLGDRGGASAGRALLRRQLVLPPGAPGGAPGGAGLGGWPWGLGPGAGCPGGRPGTAFCSSGPARRWPPPRCWWCPPSGPGACICPMCACWWGRAICSPPCLWTVRPCG